MDLRFTEEDERFRIEARQWLEATRATTLELAQKPSGCPAAAAVDVFRVSRERAGTPRTVSIAAADVVSWICGLDGRNRRMEPL